MSPRVYILEANQAKSALFADLERISSDFELRVATTSADAMLADLQMTRPDLVVIDVSHPSRNGIEMIWYLGKHLPDLPILVVANETREEFEDGVGSLLDGNIKGYISKSAGSHALLTAMREIIRGGLLVVTLSYLLHPSLWLAR